jgi:hypothetical protein
MVRLAAGNWLLGYGRLPNFTEFDPAGRVLFDATLGRSVQDFGVEESPCEDVRSRCPRSRRRRSGMNVWRCG